MYVFIYLKCVLRHSHKYLTYMTGASNKVRLNRE